MRSLLLCSQSQALINQWINNIEDPYVVVMSETELYATLAANKKQIVLYDLQSFSNSLVDIMREASVHDVKVFALTGAPSFEEGSRLLPLKISGYGNSYMTAENLQMALDVISEQKIWLYPDFVQALIAEAAHASQARDNSTALIGDLTSKEMEVSKLVAQGMTNKEVASRLGVTERTVKAHLTHIYEKLNISDRLTLALMFKE
jgi:DNA-binding NarL/FixJ family response regulator